jgi:hypothetical protein
MKLEENTVKTKNKRNQSPEVFFLFLQFLFSLRRITDKNKEQRLKL